MPAKLRNVFQFLSLVQETEIYCTINSWSHLKRQGLTLSLPIDVYYTQAPDYDARQLSAIWHGAEEERVGVTLSEISIETLFCQKMESTDSKFTPISRKVSIYMHASLPLPLYLPLSPSLSLPFPLSLSLSLSPSLLLSLSLSLITVVFVGTLTPSVSRCSYMYICMP